MQKGIQRSQKSDDRYRQDRLGKWKNSHRAKHQPAINGCINVPSKMKPSALYLFLSNRKDRPSKPSASASKRETKHGSTSQKNVCPVKYFAPAAPWAFNVIKASAKKESAKRRGTWQRTGGPPAGSRRSKGPATESKLILSRSQRQNI